MAAKLGIRPASPDDSADLARLAGQLGYPCESREVKARLALREGDSDATVLVGAFAESVVAWLSLEFVSRFYLEPYVEITGFVVDEARRGEGIGRELLGAAEDWARGHGVSALRLKSSVLRAAAHRFYERNGFARVKEQYTFAKRL